jgi:hypothetical protein
MNHAAKLKGNLFSRGSMPLGIYHGESSFASIGHTVWSASESDFTTLVWSTFLGPVRMALF